jgi:hypothetical protein
MILGIIWLIYLLWFCKFNKDGTPVDSYLNGFFSLMFVAAWGELACEILYLFELGLKAVT